MAYAVLTNIVLAIQYFVIYLKLIQSMVSLVREVLDEVNPVSNPGEEKQTNVVNLFPVRSHLLGTVFTL